VPESVKTGALTVQRWISEQKCSAKTIRNRFGVFRLVIQYAKSCGYIQSFDFKGLRFPKRGLINQSCFAADEAKKIIEATREPFQTMFWLAAETGMRGGELCGLQIEDIFDRAVFVRRSAWRGKLQTPKSQKAVRRVEISSALAEHLTRHIGNRTTGHVFQTRERTPFDNYNIVSWELKPLLKKLGIDRTEIYLVQIHPAEELQKARKAAFETRLRRWLMQRQNFFPPFLRDLLEC